VESLSSRLDFSERRARALEGVVQYKAGDAPEAEAAPPAAGESGPREAPREGGAAPGSPDARRKRRRRRGRRGGARGPEEAAAAGGGGEAADTEADGGPGDEGGDVIGAPEPEHRVPERDLGAQEPEHRVPERDLGVPERDLGAQEPEHRVPERDLAGTAGRLPWRDADPDAGREEP